jgi:uncharacterized protein
MSVHTNSLISETSPYLLQHAHNPVDWHPWSDGALALAKSLDKPIFISIGYSACHWCHVMERESFENEDIAALMNNEFVCVKVDREERPDIDAIYMQSVQMLNGHGGWPLNCFALPDGRPFWGGTYFRSKDFLELLGNVSNLYRSRKVDLEDQAEQVMQGLRYSIIEANNQASASVSREAIDGALLDLSSHFDKEEGGFKGAPKFPMPVVWLMLLKNDALNTSGKYFEQVSLTLLRMAYGGIYDQAGGGFARYSTDRKWKVPHFEKMLYDNAQLISLYSDAYKIDKLPLFREVIDDTLGFIEREMTAPGGGFYSALDADSDGHEGRFYAWSQEEWNSCLGEYAGLMGKYFSIGGEGEWENGANILVRTQADNEFAEQNFLSIAELKALVTTSKRTLLKIREKRTRPATDTKIIASWNAMMIKAYADAYSSTGNETYLEIGISEANFILGNLTDANGRMFHIYSSGNAHINGFLEDYAFMADAMLALYQATFDESWLYKSLSLSEYTLEHFSGEHPVMLHMTEQGKNKLPINPVETIDGVIPSANTVLASTIYRLGRFFYRPDLSNRALEMLAHISADALKNPSSYSHWLSLAQEVNAGSLLTVICGIDFTRFRKEMSKHYLPFVLFAGSSGQSNLPCLADRFTKDSTLIYICSPDFCMEPFENVREAILAIKGYFSSPIEESI